MKTNILFVLLWAFIAQAQEITEAGRWMGEGKFKDQPMLLADDAAMEKVIESVKAYNAGDVEKELSFYSDAYKEKNAAFSRRWHKETKRLNMQPWVMFPVRIKGDDRIQVLSWSVEEREWENGSTQKQNLMEIFVFNKEGKIDNFVQWRRNYPTNEFGLAAGGKFFGRKDNEYSGRKLVFSNRGETEIIEKFVAAYNQMDIATCRTFFAKDFIVEQASGENVTFTEEAWAAYFNDIEEVNWKLHSIVPLKIANTDPASGVAVRSRETRKMKDGTVWDKELVEYFYFDLEGKINYMTQFERNVKP